MADTTFFGADSAVGSNLRAEDLSQNELRAVTVLSDRESDIVRLLEGTGQRLLIGPRGSGKSTYLKVAYFNSLDGDRVLPAYVNYAKSISIEPEFRRSSSALPLFRQWLLAQILRGAGIALEELRIAPDDALAAPLLTAKELVSALERRRIDQAPDTSFDIAEVLGLLERAAALSGRRRVILLLDDAAHAFAPEQQREFFEVFGALRSRAVSSKAAIYPGVMSFTPRFHVGHDAQLVDVWLRPEQPNYLEMMRDIASKRLPPEGFERVQRSEGLLDYLAYASFGIPRTLIAMLEQVLDDTGTTTKSLVGAADTAISEAADNALKVFTSLQAKLPRYKYFVEVGQEMVASAINKIGEYNARRPTDGRANRILLEEPLPPEILRIVGFLEYAGVVRLQVGSVSNGGRSFRVVVPHYSLLVSRNALGLGRNPSAAGAAAALSSRQHTVRVRWRLTSLLGDDYLERCRLDLGACPNCGTDRESAEARFCSNCGFALPQVSVYEELLTTGIDALPLSDAIIKRLKEESPIRQVKDILLDEESQVLLGVKYVGPKRAARIRALADEFVYE